MDNEVKILCPKCVKSKGSYILENRNPFCPYIKCYNGKECTMFKEIRDTLHK